MLARTTLLKAPLCRRSSISPPLWPTERFLTAKLESDQLAVQWRGHMQSLLAGWSKGFISAAASCVATERARGVSPAAPTDSFLHNRPGTAGQPQAEQGPHRGDAITRCDALAFPDSTHANECVSLAMVFTIDLWEELLEENEEKENRFDLVALKKLETKTLKQHFATQEC
jgi:hypothetical protein